MHILLLLLFLALLSLCPQVAPSLVIVLCLCSGIKEKEVKSRMVWLERIPNRSQTWDRILHLHFTNCVTWAKSPDLSEPQVAQL